MRKLRAAGKFVVYSIDDYIFQPSCAYGIPGWGPEFFSMCFKEANAVTASTNRLLTHIPVPNKFRYSDALDRFSMDVLKKMPKIEGSPFAFAWLAGTNHHGMDSFVQEFLWHLDSRLSAKCVFHRYGRHLRPEDYYNIQVQTHPYVPVENWKELYRQYSTLSLDAAISPLPEDEEFCHCKAELKYVEAGSMGTPIVVSRMVQFLEVIKEGENGFFASTPEEFADKVAMLSKNPAVGQVVGSNARTHVEKEWLSSKRAAEFMTGLRMAMEYRGS
jgi:glycosyltransferase involved in cell wall biosynthesis